MEKTDLKGKWVWFRGNSVEGPVLREIGLVSLGDWLRDVMSFMEWSSGTGYIICGIWCEMKT